MNFESIKLGDVVEEITVGHVGPMASEYVASGIPFLRSQNVLPFSITTNDIRYIAPNFHARLKKSSLRPGDVVIVRTGKPGTCAVIPDWLEEANCSDLVIVRCGKRVHPRYVAYWVNSLAAHHISGHIVGAVQQHFNVGAARQMPILLPEFDDQLRVLEVLGSLDDKIELNRRMNEALETMAQAIFRDWFVDFGPTHRKIDGTNDPVEIMGGIVTDPDRAQQLADLFPAQLADSGLPDGWQKQAFSEFIDIIGGGTPKTSIPEYWDGDIPWFSVVDTPPKGSVFVLTTEKSITPRGLSESSARLVRAGTTIISARGTVGNLAIAGRDMAFNQSCYALQGINGVGDYFVFLACQQVVERLRAMAHGSVFSTITRRTFESVEIAAATPSIMDAFEEMVSPLFAKLKADVEQSRTLAATRDLLLPKLMSGEIRLRDARRWIEDAA